ncbi:ABC transporter ATP-binding protein [Actinomadura litoris]|uniref:ABC transporter ATP-binding protein n=1 Tax=Actinomadura litoris TaxID=2678616 RepID=UPI001FA79719|nr:ABC transporter ATP-binding protein [Actinomadura litoris]
MKATVSGIGMLTAIAWRVSRRKTLTAVILMVAGTAAEPLLAASLGLMTDAVVSADPAAATAYGLWAAGFAVATLSFGNFAHVAYFELAELAEQSFVERLMTLSNGSSGIEHHERSDFADELTILEPESRRFPDAMEALFTGFGLVLAIGFTGVLLAGVDPVLLLLPIVAVPPLLAGRRAETIMERAREATAERRRTARNLFRFSTSARAAGEIRVFGLDGRLRRRHAALWESASRDLWRAGTRAALVRAAGQLVFGTAYIGAVILVIREAISGRHSVGDVVLVIALATQVNQQVASAVVLLGELLRTSSTLHRLESAHTLVTGDADVPAEVHAPERLRSGIELQGVGFAYPGGEAEALHDISLTLPAGSVVAVVGENGAGKSTLVKLLCGLYRPTAGRILIDGADLRRIPIERWRERISAAFQDFVRYELSAREAVGVGDISRMDDDGSVLKALRRAEAADVVAQLEAGLDTRLGTSYTEGAELSGGQWQKLALGRSFMRDAPLLLILDEPTAALDPEAEHRLFERYDARARTASASTGAITLLVSHRFSTIRMADLIVVLRDGRIVEIGDHATLLKKSGLYAELFHIQANAYTN